MHGRPDILAAEAQLHAAIAAIGVAIAQLYPSLTLSPSLAVQTFTAGGRFDGADLLASMAGSVVTPVFHGGTLQAQRRAAVDAYEANLGIYQQTVLEAFGQVADVLYARSNTTPSCSAPRILP